MNVQKEPVSYYAGFYPMALSLVTVEKNGFPAVWWMPASKDPFRFLLAIDRTNHSLELIRQVKGCVLQFLPWTQRLSLVWAGLYVGSKKR